MGDFVICKATGGRVYEQTRKSGSISQVFSLLLQGSPHFTNLVYDIKENISRMYCI